MNHNLDAVVTLENDHVLLRTLTAADYDFLLPFSLDEPQLWEFSFKSAAGEENLSLYIDAALGDKDKGTAHPFIVYDKLKGAYAGSTRFYDIHWSLKHYN